MKTLNYVTGYNNNIHMFK